MVIIDQLIVIQVDDTKSALKATEDLMRIKGCSDTSFVSLGTVYLIAIAIQK